MWNSSISVLSDYENFIQDILLKMAANQDKLNIINEVSDNDVFLDTQLTGEKGGQPPSYR